MNRHSAPGRTLAARFWTCWLLSNAWKQSFQHCGCEKISARVFAPLTLGTTVIGGFSSQETVRWTLQRQPMYNTIYRGRNSGGHTKQRVPGPWLDYISFYYISNRLSKKSIQKLVRESAQHKSTTEIPRMWHGHLAPVRSWPGRPCQDVTWASRPRSRERPAPERQERARRPRYKFRVPPAAIGRLNNGYLNSCLGEIVKVRLGDLTVGDYLVNG